MDWRFDENRARLTSGSAALASLEAQRKLGTVRLTVKTPSREFHAERLLHRNINS
jgi:hypothetical protein